MKSLVIAILLLCTGCATQKRCFDKYGAPITVTVKDTIYIPKETVKFSFQTLIDTLELVDTFIINKERVRAIFTRDTILIECKSDTVYTEKIIEIPAIKEPLPHWSKNPLLPWLIALIILVFGLFYFIKR
jgi:hypothetical protein